MSEAYLIIFKEIDDLERDELHIRGDCYRITEPQLDRKAEKTCIDKRISKTILEAYRGGDVLRETKAGAARELVHTSPAEGYQDCALIPIREFNRIRKELARRHRWAKLWKNLAKNLWWERGRAFFRIEELKRSLKMAEKIKS